MRRILLAGLIVAFMAHFVCAQKRTTVLGDAWTGEVMATSDATREITLRHIDIDKTETFVGILREDYKVKTRDGSLRELKLSEIAPGTRIRVFYKTKQQDVGGQKVKLSTIHRLDFLGRDEFTRLREALELEPSLPVILAESVKLATTDPIKIHLVIEQPHVKESLVAWVNSWNREQATKYGAIELVPEFALSDISVVIFEGRDESIVSIPVEMYDERSGQRRNFFPVTSYVVTKDATGLKVLWQRFLLLGKEQSEGSARFIWKEIEKRMKARVKK